MRSHSRSVRTSRWLVEALERRVLLNGDPNDQISEAWVANIGSANTGLLDVGTDVDMFSVTVAVGQRLAFDVDRSGSPALGDSFLRLFDAAGTQLSSNDDAAAPGEAAGTDSYLEYTFASAGTFYVGVSGDENRTYNASTGEGDVSGSTGNYQLWVSIVPVTDGNDQIAEAVAVSLGSTTYDGMNSATDVDMYRFTAGAGQRIGFDLDSFGGTPLGDSYLRLFNSSGTQLASNDDAAGPGETLGADSYLAHTFTTAGTYYVAVSGDPNRTYNAVDGSGDVDGSTGNYSLRIEDADTNDQISEALTLVGAKAGQGTIDNGTDVDMFFFTVLAGQRFGIDLDRDPLGGLGDSYLRLFNASGTQLTANDDAAAPGEGATSDSYIAYTFSTAGTYYIGVSGDANRTYNPTTGGGDVSGSTGKYRLSVVEIDNNDQIGEALFIVGSSTSGTILTGKDVDMFAFTVSAGESVGLDVDAVGGSPLTNSYLRVFNASGTQLASNDNGNPPGEGSSSESYLKYTFATAGTYYVGVSGAPNSAYNATTGTGDVDGATGQFVLYRSDPDNQISEAMSFWGESASGTISPNIDVDMYKITVAAGSTMSFDVDRSAVGGLSDSYLRLFNGSGTELAANDDGPGTEDSYLTYTFASAGTYYIGVSGDGNRTYNPTTGAGNGPGSTGGYTLHLRDRYDQICEAKTGGGSGVMETGKEVYMFRFTVAAGEGMYFDVDTPGPGGLGDSFLRLFNSSGTQLDSNDNGTDGIHDPEGDVGDDSFLAYTFASAGTYYVGISGDNNRSYNPTTGGGDTTGSTGSFDLWVGDW